MRQQLLAARATPVVVEVVERLRSGHLIRKCPAISAIGHGGGAAVAGQRSRRETCLIANPRRVKQFRKRTKFGWKI